MTDTIVVIEDNVQTYERISDSINNHFNDSYEIVSFEEIDNLICDLNNFINPYSEDNFINCLKSWCNTITKEKNILAFVIDINLFNSTEITGLDLKNLIREKRIFVSNEDFSTNIPVFITSGIEDQEIIDNIDNKHVVNDFIPKGGTEIENRLVKILQKSIEDYKKIIRVNVVVNNGNYIENNYNGELIKGE